MCDITHRTCHAVTIADVTHDRCMRHAGIDVSSYQGTIDFNSLKSAGLSFLITKVLLFILNNSPFSSQRLLHLSKYTNPSPKYSKPSNPPRPRKEQVTLMIH